jgi:hypothetical protein
MKLIIILGSFGLDSNPDPNSNPDPQHCFSLNAGPDQAHNITVTVSFKHPGRIRILGVLIWAMGFRIDTVYGTNVVLATLTEMVNRKTKMWIKSIDRTVLINTQNGRDNQSCGS